MKETAIRCPICRNPDAKLLYWSDLEKASGKCRLCGTEYRVVNDALWYRKSRSSRPAWAVFKEEKK